MAMKLHGCASDMQFLAHGPSCDLSASFSVWSNWSFNKSWDRICRCWIPPCSRYCFKWLFSTRSLTAQNLMLFLTLSSIVFFWWNWKHYAFAKGGCMDKQA